MSLVQPIVIILLVGLMAVMCLIWVRCLKVAAVTPCRLGHCKGFLVALETDLCFISPRCKQFQSFVAHRE